MPRHSKHDKAKRPWYDNMLPTPQRTLAQKIFRFALFHDWELRPQHLGIWVMARKRYRIFITFSENGQEMKSAVLVVNGIEDQERELTLKQTVKFLKRYGRLYEP